ncbi:MAG: ribonuclease D [Planctomycetota bacterium]|nr:MAG: ribonuclease D [Planctomycetota bacterium]
MTREADGGAEPGASAAADAARGLPKDERLVVDEGALRRALEVLEDMEVLAVDTEFLWERTYHPKLALLQVAGRDAAGAVRGFAFDPLAVDLAPVWERLLRTDTLKVLHAGRLDQQIAVRLAGAPLRPAFDTQRAAALLGLGPQIGYANLVEAILGRRLAKGEQYTDWTRRPLRASQVDYALLDVVPLVEVHERLRARLEERGRLAWAEEEMTSLTDPRSYAEPPPDELYTKIKRHKTLDRRGLAALQRLARWRDEEARRRDRRPGHVIKDATLVQLAARRPRSLRALREVRGLHPREAERSGKKLLGILEEVRRLPDSKLPPARRKERPTQSVGAAVDLLRAYLAQRCSEEDLAPETVATSAELERLARDAARERFAHQHPLLRGWRGELVGADLLKILRGELGLSVDPRTGTLRLRAQNGDG